MPPVLSEDSLLDVERWLLQVDLYSLNFGCNRADVLVTLVDDKIQDIFRSHELIESRMNDAERYENLKQVLRRTCSRPVASIRARDLFLTRRQSTRKSAGAFAHDLKILAAQAFPDCTQKYRDDFILKQFVAGLVFEDVKTRLKASGPYSLQKAVEIAEFCEQMPATRPTEDTRNVPATPVAPVSSPSTPSTSSQASSRTSSPSTANTSSSSTPPNINMIHSRITNTKVAYLNNVPVKYLLDTGSDFTIISEAVLARLNIPLDSVESFVAY